MFKKVIGIFLVITMLTAILCVGVGSVTASAIETYTYYFLAPDKYFKTEAGAANTSVGAFWWEPDQIAEWPGVEMTPAPEVGKNVFKIEGVPSEALNIVFNAFVDTDDPKFADAGFQTVIINTEGYEKDEAYEGCPVCSNFNGMIYVINMNYENTLSELQLIMEHGAWFTLDDYKNNETYYGSYDFDAVYPEKGTDSEIEKDTDSKEPPAENTKYHTGDTVTAAMTAGGLNIDGAPAKLGAYNYDIYFDPDVVKVVSCTDKTTGGQFVYNPDLEDVIKLSVVATLGVNEDFSGAKAPVSEVVFEVTKNTDDLGIRGCCTSLSVVSMDGVTMKNLIGVYNPEDNSTELLLDGIPQPNSPFPSPEEEDNEDKATDSGKPYGNFSDNEVKNNTNKNMDTDSAPENTDSAPANTDSAPANTDTSSKNTDSASSNTDSSSSDSSKVTSPKTGYSILPAVWLILALVVCSAYSTVRLSYYKEND